MQTTIGKAPISKAVRIALTLTLAIGLAVPAALVSALCSPAKAYANGSATITSRGSEAYDGYSTNYFAADGVLAWCSQPNLGTPNGQYPYRSIWGSESFEARVAVIALYLATADCAWSGTSWSHDVYDITYDIAFDASADIPWNVKLQADNIVCMHNIEDSIYCRWHVLISYVLNECWPGYCDPTRGCTNPREWSEQGRAMYEYCCALANGQAYGIVTEAEAQLVKARAENSEIRMTSGGAMQDIVWLNYLGPGYGALELDKDSSNESITAGNDCYNLEGAVYSAFSDAACTNLVASSETNTDGWLRVDSLEPGSYFVRETTAAPGFDLDETVYPVAVKAGETSLVNGGRVFDAPSGSSASLSLKKRSTEDSYAVALGGAQYTMTYFDGLYDTQSEAESSGDPLRTWVFETDGNGIIEVSDESYFAGGDELFRNGGAIFFPRGTYLVKETHAPEGFFLNESVGVYRITDSTSGWTWMSSADPNDATRLDEQPVNAGFELEKVDADLMVCAPQGDATLKGATYSVKNASGRPVCVNGTVFGDGESVFSITTDASGRASCDIDTLPYGTYTVHEVTPSEGYLVSSETKTFSVTQDGVTIDGGSWPERVIHGGLSMTKLDSETLANLPLGGATLKGAEFTVQNASEHNVVVEGATFAPSQDVVTLEADEQGNVATSADFLPFGTYTVRETAAPLGYLPSDEVWTVEIRENGVIHTPQSVDECIDNRVMRSDVSLVKANETTGERMANIPFRITSASTGESHVLVTDVNGAASTSSEWAAHTRRTNASDNAPEDKLDPLAGVWFGMGPHGNEAPARDDLGALPYGTYTIEELPVRANEGLQLVALTVDVYRDGTCIDLGTIDDVEPVIRTFATDGLDGDKHLAADTNAIIVDRVEYDELVSHRTYTLHASLFDAESGEALEQDGAPVTAETTFTPETSNGYIDMRIELDASSLANRKIVVVEELSCDGRIIAEHRELDDANQTVSVIERTIDTSATCGATGKKTLSRDPEACIVDIVEYFGLSAGHTYEIEGHIMAVANDGTCTDLVSGGNAATTRISFEATGPTGSVEVPFSFDATDIAAGTKLVVCETLLSEGKVVAQHADATDADQTVTVTSPEINTTLRDSASPGNAVCDPESVLIDTIEYRNLVPGKSYRLLGSLMTKDATNNGNATEKALLDADGHPVTASTEFTPLDSHGTIELTYPTIDTSRLAGQPIVSFASLTRCDVEVAAHADIDDLKQTVVPGSPKMTTLLTDTDQGSEGDGDKDVSADPETTLVDHVSYQNLIPGKTYTLEGSLHLKAAGEDGAATSAPLAGSDGKPITATCTFEPVDSYGTVDVAFPSFDTSSLAGKAIVCFEKLSRGGVTLAEHANINDEAQTVTPSSPTIATRAVDAVDADKHLTADPHASIVDTVNYANLTAHREYTLEAAIMVKEDTDESCRPLLGAAGEPAKTTLTFTPVASHGSIDVVFDDVDVTGIAGKRIVVFESLSRNGVKLVEHADANDAEQTLDIVRPTLGTSAEDAVDGDRTIALSREAKVIDTVTYRDLTPGITYDLRGSLMQKTTSEDGTIGASPLLDENELPIEATVSFTPVDTYGSITVELPFDSTMLGGEELVVFEELMRDGKLISDHAVPTAESQTVRVVSPRIATALADALDGDKVAVADPTTGFVDSVAYNGLVPWDEYTLRGILMDKTTGLPFIAGAEEPDDACREELETFWNDLCTLLGIDDPLDPSAPFTPKAVSKEALDNLMSAHAHIIEQLVTASESLTPEYANGEASVRFSCSTERLILSKADTEVVAFEALVKGSDVIAVHANIDDREQTATIATSKISTQATDATDGNKELIASHESTLKDTVSYSNLIPGHEYTVKGTLMSKGNGKTIYVNDKPLIAEGTFVPSEPSGAFDLTFTFDSTSLSGTDIVVFEELYKQNDEGTLIKVAEHADIDDLSQTVGIDKLPTGMRYGKTGLNGWLVFGCLAITALAGICTLAYAAHQRKANEK